MFSNLSKILELINQFAPDILVIEETCAGSKNVYSQKILEWTHFLVAKFIYEKMLKNEEKNSKLKGKNINTDFLNLF